MDTNKVWLVTGASKGLGLVLVQQLLKGGYKVAATSRSIADLTKELGKASDKFLPLEVDLVNEESVSNAITKTINTFGTIDVVVNNAGYGQIGTLEELSDEESRRNFDANVFGSLNVIRHVMPHLREKKSGAIFNIGSVGGFFGGFPGWGIYCATKYAMAGFTEALAAETKSLGITATIVYPGYFRTNFLSKGSLHLPKNPIAAYKEARDTEALHENHISGNQPGDPEKAAEVLIKVASKKNPPLHLFLGKDSYEMAKGKMKTVEAEMKEYLELATSTDF